MVVILLISENKLLWTYDFIFFNEDGTTETQRGRFDDNDTAMKFATLLLNRRNLSTECHVYSIVRRSKMLIGKLEPMSYSLEDLFEEPVEVRETMKEVQLKGWTIKWEGQNEAFVNEYSFILLNEDKDSLVYISFEEDSFIIKPRELYGIYTKVDPLNTTISIIEERVELEEN